MSAAMVTVRGGALLILDPEDQFAQRRGLSGPHPRPLGRFCFFLVATRDSATGEQIRLAPRLEMNVTPNPSGFYLFFGNVTQADGTKRRMGTQDWPWTITVESDYYQTLEIQTPEAYWSSEGGSSASSHIPLPLAPGPTYPFPDEPAGYPGGRLRGVLRRADGSRVAGVRVEVLDVEENGAGDSSLPGNQHRSMRSQYVQPMTALTGKDGQWVLVVPVLPSSGLVNVGFTYLDGTTTAVQKVPVARGRDNNLPQAALRGAVRRKSAGVPGAVVRISSMRGLQVMTDEVGNWVCYLDISEVGREMTVSAQLPASRLKKDSTVTTKARETVTVPVFEF